MSEQKVLDLLESLERDKNNFSNYLKFFEEYYFTQKPILNNNYIKRLFFVINVFSLLTFRVTAIK